MTIQNKRHVLLSLDTIMSWANECLPDSDAWGYIDYYGKMPANPHLFKPEEWEPNYFETVVENFISSMYNEIDEVQAKHFESLIRKIPYEEL